MSQLTNENPSSPQEYTDSQALFHSTHTLLNVILAGVIAAFGILILVRG
jgi:hypothetical protein